MSVKTGVRIVTNEETGMVVLDFGEYGTITIPPEQADALISNQEVRESIRVRARQAHQARRKMMRVDNADNILALQQLRKQVPA